MTDLEKHVNRPGRDKQVKKVREKINELGITYIYYQFISVTGRVVGKGIPADHWERTAEKGFQLVYGATANLFLDRHNNYIGCLLYTSPSPRDRSLSRMPSSA